MMPSTAPTTRLSVRTSAARMRFIGHMYLISRAAPSSAVTTPSVTQAVMLFSTTAQTAIAPNTSKRARQQRNDDADNTDGDDQRDQDDAAGAHGFINVLLGRETSSTLCAVAAPAMGRPLASSNPSCTSTLA